MWIHDYLQAICLRTRPGRIRCDKKRALLDAWELGMFTVLAGLVSTQAPNR